MEGLGKGLIPDVALHLVEELVPTRPAVHDTLSCGSGGKFRRRVQDGSRGWTGECVGRVSQHRQTP